MFVLLASVPTAIMGLLLEDLFESMFSGPLSLAWQFAVTAALLGAAGSFDPGLALLNPICLASPIAPHIAAAEDGVVIEPGKIREAFAALKKQADVVLVEGVGGFRVPLGEDYDTADLARDLGLPVILVVGMRLGCINHALLTAEAIAAPGGPRG